MGLDMYFYKRRYVKNRDHTDPDMRHKVTVEQGGKVLPIAKFNPERVCYIEEDIGYWRKANHIHAWFVENVQGGVDNQAAYNVSPDQLRELLELCKQVTKDHSLAGELLPTQSGFFFGSTEYDDDYFENIELTIRIIETALEDEGAEFQYSCWW